MTKAWDEHRATIISLYKEQHKPLHEVQKLMAEQHGFVASVRAYRSRFDKWDVHKYNCRRRRASTSNRSSEGSPRTEGSEFSPRSEDGESPLVATTPPSTPQVDEAASRTAERGREQHLTLQPVSAMAGHHSFFGQSAGTLGSRGGGNIPPSPGPSVGGTESTESTSSGSNASRTSSISQPFIGVSNSLAHGNHHQRHSRSELDYSTSPTETQFSPYEMYQQQPYHSYQGLHQYHHLHGPPGVGGLALPPGLNTQQGQSNGLFWPASPLQAPYHVSSADVKAPRD